MSGIFAALYVRRQILFKAAGAMTAVIAAQVAGNKISEKLNKPEETILVKCDDPYCFPATTLYGPTPSHECQGHQVKIVPEDK